MQRLLGIGRICTRLRFCALENPEKSHARLSLLKLQKRTSMSKISDVLEKRLREQDDIPEDFRIIYRGGMDSYIHAAYSISTICLGLGIWSVYYIFDSDVPLKFPLHSAWDKLIGIENYTQLFILYASYFAMVLIIRGVSRKYVMRMYFNEKTETYRAVRVGYIPTATRYHDFKAHSLHRIEKKRIVPWWNAQYKCNGEKLLIMDEGFKTNADYDRMFRD